MNIIQWNCRGIRSNSESLRILMKDSEASIIALQETKLGTNHNFNPGINYTFHRSPGIIGEVAQGGTSFVVHKSIKHHTINLNTILQSCAIRVYSNKPITLCSIYLEPLLENRLTDNAGNRRNLNITDLQSLINQLPTPYILMGDFNAKHTLWGESSCNHRGNLIDQLLDNNDIVLLNDGSYTRVDSYHNTFSAIDLSICSSNLTLDYQWSVFPYTYGSDHYPILLKSTLNIPSSCLPKWKTDAANWKEYTESTRINAAITYDEFLSPIEAYEFLYHLILEKANQHIPKTSGTPRRPVVPWWNKECAVA